MKFCENEISSARHSRDWGASILDEDEHAIERRHLDEKTVCWKALQAAFRESERKRAVAATFAQLVFEWKSRKSHSSSIEEMAIDLSYQRIIGLGPDAIPLILEELRREPDHWFWALGAIARVNPIPDDSRGRLLEMADAWINWGREQGLIS